MEASSLPTRSRAVAIPAFGWWNKLSSPSDPRLPSRIVHEAISSRLFRLIVTIIAIKHLPIAANIEVIVAITSPTAVPATIASILVVVIVAHSRELFKLPLLLLVLVLKVIVLAALVLLHVLLKLPASAHEAILLLLLLRISSLLPISGVVMAWRSTIWHVPLVLVLLEVSFHLCGIQIVAVCRVDQALESIDLLPGHPVHIAEFLVLSIDLSGVRSLVWILLVTLVLISLVVVVVTRWHVALTILRGAIEIVESLVG